MPKAFIQTEQNEQINCDFNPEAFGYNLKTRWEGRPVGGRLAPPLQFVGGDPATMHLDLLFDTTDTGQSVKTSTDKLHALMKIDSRAPGYDPATKTGRPLWCKFCWGSFVSFKAIIDSLGINFTYFASDGTPLRARVAVDLRQFEEQDDWGPQNPTSGTPEPHQLHQVLVGQTLDRIAAQYYGDSTKWRLIASYNKVLNPLAVEPGTVLAIPKPDGSDA